MSDTPKVQMGDIDYPVRLYSSHRVTVYPLCSACVTHNVQAVTNGKTVILLPVGNLMQRGIILMPRIVNDGAIETDVFNFSGKPVIIHRSECISALVKV